MSKVITVKLNLEESGILCHLMMGEKQFRDWVCRGMKETGHPVLVRWARLYDKLAKANDELMGKVMNDRLPGSCWSNPIWYREKWRIYLGDGWHPSTQYAYSHDDYDGAPDAKDHRAGYAESVEACKKEIDELMEDE
jgi:hypothetical protein